jgi:hypothetical protein
MKWRLIRGQLWLIKFLNSIIKFQDSLLGHGLLMIKQYRYGRGEEGAAAGTAAGAGAGGAEGTVAGADMRSRILVNSHLSHERGDVPGWVLVVLMTAGLVTGIWTVAAPRLNQILRSSLDSMNAIR